MGSCRLPASPPAQRRVRNEAARRMVCPEVKGQI